MAMSAKTYSDSAIEDLLKSFLQSFKRDGDYPYVTQIDALLGMNKTSITVDFTEFMESEAFQIFMEEPSRVLVAFSEAIEMVVRMRRPDYAESNKGRFAANMINFPLTKKMRDIGLDDIGRYVSMRAMLMQVSIPEMLTLEAFYQCADGHGILLYADANLVIPTPVVCPNSDCKLRDLELIPEKSKFIDYQILYVQELQDEVSAGTLPVSAEILVTGDLVNSSRMGNIVLVSGIMRAEISKKIKLRKEVPTYRLRMYGNNVVSEQDDESVIGVITEEEEKTIRSMITKIPPEDATKLVVQSFAQRIRGYNLIKEALLLTVIAGNTIEMSDGSKMRGDINTFLVGDPGVAKSELGKAVEITAPRAVYTSGRGSTGVGLTASTILDKASGVYMIKPGATVLGDGGITIIDEFDKMRIEDRSSLHEVMEQQCYCDKTEILTEDGWKLFKDVRNVRVATLSYGEIEFVWPEKHYSYHHKGGMVRFEADQIDLSVTPNHNMYVNIDSDDTDWRNYKHVRADALPAGQIQFMKTGKWGGRNVEKYVAMRDNHRPFVLDMKDWLQFLGYYMAAGGIERKDDDFNSIIFDLSGMNKGARDRLAACIGRIGFESEPTNDELIVNSKQLATHISWFGWTRSKVIPSEIRELSPEYLSVLLGAMLDGQGGGRFFTLSSMLAWNFQEICAKLGRAANDTIVYRMGEKSDIRGFESDALLYNIHGLDVVEPSMCYPRLDGSKIHGVKYDGMVYCVEVPGHVVYVRRNGKPVWCGNSVSLSKGGRMARLNARTGILAIANPLHGRYDKNKTLPENIPSIPPTLLSRFDLIFIMRDTPDAERDEEIMDHVETMYSNGKDGMTLGMDIKMFRKYLRLAKACRPKLTGAAWKEIKAYYRQMRLKASDDVAPITVRQFEGLVRLTTARAKMLLKDTAGLADARRAIDITDEMLKTSSVDLDTGEVDMGVVRGTPTREIGARGTFLKLFRELADIKGEDGVRESDMINEMTASEKWDREAAKSFFERMHQGGHVIERRSGRFYPE